MSLRISALFLLTLAALPAADPAPKRHDLKARASNIDRKAKEHPEIGFAFGTAAKPLDLQHACVDTRVPSAASS